MLISHTPEAFEKPTTGRYQTKKIKLKKIKDHFWAQGQKYKLKVKNMSSRSKKVPAHLRHRRAFEKLRVADEKKLLNV